jgi:hypothetical protein
MPVLMQGLAVALDFRPLATPERSALVTRTAPAGVDDRFEAFKTATRFDGTTQHPKWMETTNL